MDKDQQRLNLEGLIKKLRTVTTAVQLLPFVYGFLFIFSMVAYLVFPDWVSTLCDHLFYVSAVVIIYNLILSRVLRLCRWHRAACLVPLIPEVVSLADQTVLNLSIYAVYINIGIIILSTGILLIAAYKVFMK